jgi:hypothetical protein
MDRGSDVSRVKNVFLSGGDLDFLKDLVVDRGFI